MSHVRESFATQVSADLLSAMREIAETEGRQLEALVDEAFAEFVERHKKQQPRAHIMEAYLASHEKFGDLYKKLAE